MVWWLKAPLQKGVTKHTEDIHYCGTILQQVLQSLLILILLPLPSWKEGVGLFSPSLVHQPSGPPSTLCPARHNAIFVPGRDSMTRYHVHSPGLKVEQGDWPERREASPLLPLNKKSGKHHNKGRAGQKPLLVRQGEEACFLQYLPFRGQRTCSGAAGKKAALAFLHRC